MVSMKKIYLDPELFYASAIKIRLAAFELLQKKGGGRLCEDDMRNSGIRCDLTEIYDEPSGQAV